MEPLDVTPVLAQVAQAEYRQILKQYRRTNFAKSLTIPECMKLIKTMDDQVMFRMLYGSEATNPHYEKNLKEFTTMVNERRRREQR